MTTQEWIMETVQTKKIETPQPTISLKMEDIRPEKAEFVLKSTGLKYTLRPVNMDDELWLRRKYGDQIEGIFRDIRIQEICEIVFHQMDDATRELFVAQDVTIMNEQGEKATERRGGVALLRCLLIGLEDKMLVFNALMQTLGISRPMIDKLLAQEEALRTPLLSKGPLEKKSP